MSESPLRDNSALGLQHPEWVDGRKLWLDPEVKQVVDWLHNGYPTLGWEGDPALALYLGDKGEWVINRFENGQYRTVCRSKPGVHLDARVIMLLVHHDLRRRSAFDILDEVNKHNDALEKAVDDAAHAKAADALEKVYWGVQRDVGYHY